MAAAQQYAYLIISPDPTDFQSIETLTGRFPVLGGWHNAPVTVNGSIPRVCHVKFGDQSSADGALRDYVRTNPNFKFITISINGVPVPGWNRLGKFLENQVLGTFNTRHVNSQPFRRAGYGEEWYYLWNRDQLLRNFIHLHSRATQTAGVLVGNPNDVNLQNQNNAAQRGLNQPLVQHIQALKRNNSWPGWASFTSGTAALATQTQQRNAHMQNQVDSLVASQQRLVWVDNNGVLHFVNELAAVCFFDQYLQTD